MSKSLSGMTTPNPAKPPDGQEAALIAVADAGLPPERTLRVAPSLARQQDEGGKVQEVEPPRSISGRDTLERGVMSGELPLTYLTLDSFSLSLFPLSIHYSLLLPFYIFTGS
jgi:hypothetical protein